MERQSESGYGVCDTALTDMARGIAEIVCPAETPWLTHVSVASFSKATASEDGRVHPFKDAGAEKEGAVWEKWLD